MVAYVLLEYAGLPHKHISKWIGAQDVSAVPLILHRFKRQLQTNKELEELEILWHEAS